MENFFKIEARLQCEEIQNPLKTLRIYTTPPPCDWELSSHLEKEEEKNMGFPNWFDYLKTQYQTTNQEDSKKYSSNKHF